jgi:hypothetical protein
MIFLKTEEVHLRYSRRSKKDMSRDGTDYIEQVCFSPQHRRKTMNTSERLVLSLPSYSNASTLTGGRDRATVIWKLLQDSRNPPLYLSTFRLGAFSAVLRCQRNNGSRGAMKPDPFDARTSFR